MTPQPVALITGSLHRIGAAIAARLAADGYAIARHCRTAGDTGASMHDHPLFQAGLAQEGAADRLFDDVTAHFGRPPALIVNNAALFEAGGIADLDQASLARALAVNLVAPTLLTQRLVAAGAGGTVINILDQRVLNPVPDQIAYSIAKQALWQATRTLARAAAPHVRVNAVAPGLTLAAPDYEAGRMERMAALMPLAHLPSPDEIADAVAFLAGAHSITGQTIFVDAGASLKGYDRDFAYL